MAYKRISPIPVNEGGTGAQTFTTNGVVVGNGTSALSGITAATTGELLVGVTSSPPAFGSSATGDFTFTSATAAQNRTLTVSNTDATAANYSAAHLELITQSASTGDPYIRYNVNSGQDYSMGVDNSDSDTFKMTDDTNPSTGNSLWTMDSAGISSFPLQPSFLAYNSASDANVTGDGTVYTVIFDTEVYDVNGDYNGATGTFTAPVAGTYLFSASITLESIGAAHTAALMQYFYNGTTNYRLVGNSAAAVRNNSNVVTYAGAQVIVMAASETVVLTITVSNSTKTVQVNGGAGRNTWFSGVKIA